jgi:2-polyprenyl-3-methyl-5-hydroxy-6-metoxy-1,4-benzoquinol methylase
MIFKTKNKEYQLIKGLRDKIKPEWQEMLKPARLRNINTEMYDFQNFLTRTECHLSKHNISLVGKNILEVGCSYGERCFLMAKYEGTRVHGIDVDDYIVEQSPDLHYLIPKDVEFVHNKLEERRKELSNRLPNSVSRKVSFQTCGLENYVTKKPHDLIISWDTLEHILDLPQAFSCMAKSIKRGGIIYHEYNPFFAFNGGHSLCTLDFLYGHCRLESQDFDRYIREVRPQEEKIALNFYHKCLNRVTRGQVKKLVENDFDILEFEGNSSYKEETERWKTILGDDILEEIQNIYPDVKMEDLLCDSIHIILRKK